MRKHGMTRSKLHYVWMGMHSRCNCQSDTNYSHYGARGITVCDEWLIDFQSFYDWSMSHGYKAGMTLDRINNDGNYEPSNCRWVTMADQCRNKSSNVWLECNGERKILTDWSIEVGIARQTIMGRLKRGWTVEMALFTPVNKGGDAKCHA